MRHDTRWIIVDTETDGLDAPIHAVEIAAQAMVGWEMSGEPFQVFLNHDIPIPSQATAIHGYTREFLRREGIAPRKAYAQFAAYVDDAPIVCHNLSYDWNRVLQPECRRLRMRVAGSAGFCSMLLSRRVIPESQRHNLDTLKAHFRIRTAGRSHQASADVETVARLFSAVLAPRLTAASIDTFEAIRTFSRRTPIRACHREIRRPSNPA